MQFAASGRSKSHGKLRVDPCLIGDFRCPLGAFDERYTHPCMRDVFLLPGTILFVAFGVAPTERVNQLISAVGVLTSVVWVPHPVLDRDFDHSGFCQ